jgi:hypothetical protein
MSKTSERAGMLIVMDDESDCSRDTAETPSNWLAELQKP